MALQLTEDNPYFNATVVSFPDGTQYLEREELDYQPQQTDDYHRVTFGETPNQIAYKRYNQFEPIYAGRYWHFICDVNGIVNPLDLSSYVGTEIVVPSYPLARLRR